MSYRRLKLERTLADSLVAYCEQNLVLPDDLVRSATGQKSKEPFLLDVRQLGGRSETERMLRILYALWKSAPDSFEKAAEGVGGTRRLWFARDWHLISDTGSSNSCQRISDSPWYVSTNCPYNGMMSRVEKIMTKMGFSWRYTVFVAWFITDGKGRLWQDDYFDDKPAT